MLSADNTRLDDAYTKFNTTHNCGLNYYLESLGSMNTDGGFALGERINEMIRLKRDQLFGTETERGAHPTDPTRANKILNEICIILEEQEPQEISADGSQITVVGMGIQLALPKIKSLLGSFKNLAETMAEQTKAFPPRFQTMVQQRYNAASGSAINEIPLYESNPDKLREVTKEVYNDFWFATRWDTSRKEDFSVKSQALIEKTQQETNLEFAAAAKKVFENFEKYEERPALDQPKSHPPRSQKRNSPLLMSYQEEKHLSIVQAAETGRPENLPQPSRDGTLGQSSSQKRETTSEAKNTYNPFADVKQSKKDEDYNPFAKSTSSSQRNEPTVRQKEKNEDYNPFAKSTSSSQRNEPTVRQKEKNEDYNPFAKSTSSSQRNGPTVRQKEKNEDYNPFAKSTSSSQRKETTVKQRETTEDYNPFAKNTSSSQRKETTVKQRETTEDYNPFAKSTSSSQKNEYTSPQRGSLNNFANFKKTPEGLPDWTSL